MHHFLKYLPAAILFIASPSLASCPSSLELKDANGTTAPAKYTDDGSGNCQVNTAEQDGAQATIGSKSDSAWSSGSGSLVAIEKSISTGVNSPVPAGTNTIGGVTGALSTSGGVSPKMLNALSNSAVSVKSSQGQLFGLQCGNTNSSEEYVQIYNIASGSVTVGTSTPVLSVPIASGSTGGLVISLVGVQFSTAISVAATTTATGGSAPSTALDCNAFYN